MCVLYGTRQSTSETLKLRPFQARLSEKQPAGTRYAANPAVVPLGRALQTTLLSISLSHQAALPDYDGSQGWRI